MRQSSDSYHLLRPLKSWGNAVFIVTYPGSVQSPKASTPIRFRGPAIPGVCDHSECFLFNYDLHRLYAGERLPRIYMNPAVKVGYDYNWFVWHTSLLRVPAVRWWLGECSTLLSLRI